MQGRGDRRRKEGGRGGAKRRAYAPCSPLRSFSSQPLRRTARRIVRRWALGAVRMRAARARVLAWRDVPRKACVRAGVERRAAKKRGAPNKIAWLHVEVAPPRPRGPESRMGTTAANRHLRCPVHPRPRALRPARSLVCARPRVCARPHYQARARRTRATRRHDAQNSPEYP